MKMKSHQVQTSSPKSATHVIAASFEFTETFRTMQKLDAISVWARKNHDIKKIYITLSRPKRDALAIRPVKF